MKVEGDMKKVSLERDQLIGQLEKSQEMLVTFQKEMQQSEACLDRTRQDNERLKREQDRLMRDFEQGSKDVIQAKEKEFQRLQQQVRRILWDARMCAENPWYSKIDADSSRSIQSRIPRGSHATVKSE